MSDMATRTDHRTNAGPRGYLPPLPPPPSPLEAVRRHPLLTLVPILLLIGAAIAVASQRKPTYSAESRVAIGSFTPTEQSAPGAAYAGTQFASAYSRAITAQDVVRPAAQQVHLSPAQAAGRLSATPIPDSPFLRIQATGPSAPSALGLAAAATNSLMAYVRRSGATDATTSGLLERFRAAQAEAEKAGTKANSAREAVNRSPHNRSAKARLARARTDVETASLRASGLRSAYLQQAQSTSSGIPVRVLNPPSAASSDREQTLRLLVTVAAVAGIALGVALATAVASRRHRPELPSL
jgi:hypothetical protein